MTTNEYETRITALTRADRRFTLLTVVIVFPVGVALSVLCGELARWLTGSSTISLCVLLATLGLGAVGWSVVAVKRQQRRLQAYHLICPHCHSALVAFDTQGDYPTLLRQVTAEGQCVTCQHQVLDPPSRSPVTKLPSRRRQEL
jgi:hypothetical protein